MTGSDTPRSISGCTEWAPLTRRRLLTGGVASAASLALWGGVPKAAVTGSRDPRLLTVILRGGLDGLSMIAPVGDPDYERLRQKIALKPEGGGVNAGLALDGFFVLNPAMPFLHELYKRHQAMAVHAVSTPYRGRSHFDGQDVLESGLGGVGRTDDGWLNRALAGLPSAGQANPKGLVQGSADLGLAKGLAQGLAMGAVVPLVMRGKAPVMSWIPKANSLELRESTVARLMDLYGQSDPKLARAFSQGMDIDRVDRASGAMVAARAPVGALPPAPGGGLPPTVRPFRDFVETAEMAAKFLVAADGPRIGTLSYNGWDTHANEGAAQGQLANRLAGLDAAIRAFADGMGAAWKDTVVIVVTEFGRTAAVNGSDGTDHGTATAALLIGGAVRGGRVLANWPGLAPQNLFEARDLQPTCDLRTVLKGVLHDHLGVPSGVLATAVFPDSRTTLPTEGLIV
jgi:uncharacterized protein (DUF1501 family)